MTDLQALLKLIVEYEDDKLAFAKDSEKVKQLQEALRDNGFTLNSDRYGIDKVIGTSTLRDVAAAKKQLNLVESVEVVSTVTEAGMTDKQAKLARLLDAYNENPAEFTKIRELQESLKHNGFTINSSKYDIDESIGDLTLQDIANANETVKNLRQAQIARAEEETAKKELDEFLALAAPLADYSAVVDTSNDGVEMSSTFSYSEAKMDELNTNNDIMKK